MISFVIAISCLSLAFAVYLARQVLQRDTGHAKDAGDLQRDQRGRRSVSCRGRTARSSVCRQCWPC